MICIIYALTQQSGPWCDAVEATVGLARKEGDHLQNYYHLKYRKKNEGETYLVSKWSRAWALHLSLVTTLKNRYEMKAIILKDTFSKNVNFSSFLPFMELQSILKFKLAFLESLS